MLPWNTEIFILFGGMYYHLYQRNAFCHSNNFQTSLWPRLYTALYSVHLCVTPVKLPTWISYSTLPILDTMYQTSQEVKDMNNYTFCPYVGTDRQKILYVHLQ